MVGAAAMDADSAAEFAVAALPGKETALGFPEDAGRPQPLSTSATVPAARATFSMIQQPCSD